MTKFEFTNKSRNSNDEKTQNLNIRNSKLIREFEFRHSLFSRWIRISLFVLPAHSIQPHRHRPHHPDLIAKLGRDDITDVM